MSSENRRLNDNGEQAKLKDKPDVKSKEADNWRLMVKTEPDVKPNKEHKQDVKPNAKFDRESNQDVKEPDLLSSQFNYVEKRSKLNDKITIEPSLVELNNYEEEKVALILGTTAVFTVLWMFK